MLCVFSLGLSILPSCLSFHYEYVNENKTWYEAQSYCRENYTDLATFYDNTTNPVKEFPHVRAWIGLSSGSWIWSLKDTILDSSYTDFYQADKDVPEQSYENKICAKMFDMSWKPFNCSEEIPFICYCELIHSYIRYELKLFTFDILFKMGFRGKTHQQGQFLLLPLSIMQKLSSEIHPKRKSLLFSTKLPLFHIKC